MNFQEFQNYRSSKLAENPLLTDLAETNIWRSLSHFVPVLETALVEHVHRCHLAQEWLAVFGLPVEWSERALVSSGVRHSLSLIFSILARDGVDLRIPDDVYPVYGQLARSTALPYQTFASLPELQMPVGGDYLLLPNPLKPAGRWLTREDVGHLCDWLRGDDRRRMLLDTVYTFDTRWHSSTCDLFETEQVIVLHSLSKGWLSRQVFGVALFPNQDRDRFVSTFRENSPPNENLITARRLLRDHSGCPQAVESMLSLLREKTLALFSNEIRSAILLPPDSEPAGYLMTVRMAANELLSRHGLMSIPLTVFGSSREDCSVFSTLSCR